MDEKNNPLSIRPTVGLRESLQLSAKERNRTVHGHIINILTLYEEGKLREITKGRMRGFLNIKLTKSEKNKLRKELGI